jgi:hypothetical protein
MDSSIASGGFGRSVFALYGSARPEIFASPTPRIATLPCSVPVLSIGPSATTLVVYVSDSGSSAAAAAVVKIFALDAGSKSCPSFNAKTCFPSSAVTEMPQCALATSGWASSRFT